MPESSLLSRFARPSSKGLSGATMSASPRGTSARTPSSERGGTTVASSTLPTGLKPLSRGGEVAVGSTGRIFRPTSAKLRPASATVSAPSSAPAQLKDVTGRANAQSAAAAPLKPGVLMRELGPSLSSPLGQSNTMALTTAPAEPPLERERMRDEVAAFIKSTVARRQSEPEIREHKPTARFWTAATAAAPSPPAPPAKRPQHQVVEHQAQSAHDALVAANIRAVVTTAVPTPGQNPTKLTADEEAALSGRVGCGARNKGEYVYHFPTSGHYCCRRCRTPLFSANAKCNAGGGFATFNKHFAHSLRSEISLGSAGAATHKNTALLLLELESSPATIRMSCVRCAGFIGLLSQDRDTETGDCIKANSSSILYCADPAPAAFLQSEQCFGEDFEEVDDAAIADDGSRMTAAERRDQQRRISNWGARPAHLADRSRSGITCGDTAPVYRGAVPRGTLLTAKRTDDSHEDSSASSDSDAEDCFN